jgi:hypothetical protein
LEIPTPKTVPLDPANKKVDRRCLVLFHTASTCRQPLPSSGGLAMTAAAMSGDPADVHLLLIAYLSAYRVTVIAVIGASIYKLLKEN